jgi:hypothetical protein
MPFTESIVEDATLNCFGELDYALLHGQDIAPGEAAAEHASSAEPFLPPDRLRDALLPKLLSGELRVPVRCTQPGVPTRLAEAKS